MNTPNIDLLLSDITFRRGRLAQMLAVTVHDGDDTRFDAVCIGDLIDEVRALRQQRDEAVKRRREIDDEAFGYAEQIETLRTQLAAARVVTDAMVAKGWLLLQARCVEDYEELLDLVEREDFADALTAALAQEDA